MTVGTVWVLDVGCVVIPEEPEARVPNTAKVARVLGSPHWKIEIRGAGPGVDSYGEGRAGCNIPVTTDRRR